MAEPERSVVLAYYLGEMSVTEISRALSMPEGTVKTRLHRGRQALRKELMVP
jgi:RNA polymerase sigma-70 factor (ECF subfamily)